MLPQISMSEGCHRYYFDRLELSRTQRKMEEEFGRDYFSSTLKPGGGNAGGGILSNQECEALVAKLMIKNQEAEMEGGGGGANDDDDDDDNDYDSYGDYQRHVL